MISETLQVLQGPVAAGDNVDRVLPRKKENTGLVDAIRLSGWQRIRVG